MADALAVVDAFNSLQPSVAYMFRLHFLVSRDRVSCWFLVELVFSLFLFNLFCFLLFHLLLSLVWRFVNNVIVFSLTNAWRCFNLRPLTLQSVVHTKLHRQHCRSYETHLLVIIWCVKNNVYLWTELLIILYQRNFSSFTGRVQNVCVCVSEFESVIPEGFV